MKKIELTCSYSGCGKKFERSLSDINCRKRKRKKKNAQLNHFCSQKCALIFAKERGKQQVDCDGCGVKFEKKTKNLNYNSGYRNFCSLDCYRSNIDHSQKSPENITKEVVCPCGTKFTAHIYSPAKICAECLDEKYQNSDEYYFTGGRWKKYKFKNCPDCGVEFKAMKAKYCDDCRPKHNAMGGRASASKQIRRSKNEIYFAYLCEKQFNNTTNNELFFQSKYGLWDADIILHDQKIAVLWNGIWHYKQVRSKNHNLKKIKARDKIKLDIIVANDYIPYVIKDMGRENPKFVEEEFRKFVEYVKSLVRE